jgi:HK97 family phage major capsid protein
MPGLAKSQELRQERARLWEQNKALSDRMVEGKFASEEDRTQFVERDKAIVRLTEDIDLIEKHEKMGKDLETAQATKAGQQDRGGEPESRETVAAKRDAALSKWVREGVSALTAEERGMLKFSREGSRQYLQVRLSANPMELRAGYQGAGAANLGAETVFDEPGRAIESSMLAYGGMRDVSTIVRTGTGADLPIPTDNDTGNKGVLLGEGTQETTVTDIPTAVITLKAYKFSSDIVKASVEFVQDTSLNAFAWIAAKLGERLARAHNYQFTVGSNSSAPQGVLWGSGLGYTAASATAITRTDLLTLAHSVDPAYRSGARFMFNDSTLLALKLLTIGTSDDRPLWQPGIAVGAPNTIDGFAYTVNQDFEDIGAGNHSVVFGDFSKYLIRDVMDIDIHRFDEKYMDYGLYGFLAFTRNDGRILDAGTNPLNYMRHPAS